MIFLDLLSDGVYDEKSIMAEKIKIQENIKDFLIELKNFARNQGRSSILPIEITELFVKHQINMKEIENE